MSEARAAVYPQTTLQTCIVHLIRHSLDFANWKERTPMAIALPPLGQEVSHRRRVVAARLDAHHSLLCVSPGDPSAHLHDQRALDSVHAQLRKIIRTRGHFPNDDAATKLIWLALRNITAKWERTSHHWRAAMNQFAILYDDRLPPSPAQH